MTRHQRIPLLEWLFLAIFASILAFHTMPKAWQTLNTDFPNYYLTARLAHEGTDTARAYEWRWLQREKDHRRLDQPLIGLAPITPFSTLFVYPLTRFEPLTAKHLWLLMQLALLVPTLLLLRSLTGQPPRRIALLTVICIPLHRNLMYGQYYILLLVIMIAACWAWKRGRSVWAGALIGLAALLKIFPFVFLLFFLRKRDSTAIVSVLVTVAAGALLAVHVFGWPMHRYYLQTVLPWTLRGEVTPSYTLASSSLVVLLHRLFLFEPQWNPYPWHNLPVFFAVLAPLLQTVILAPALLLIRSRREPLPSDRLEAPLEWSALLCATLAISTSPASYNFTLLIFPVTVLCASLLPRRPLWAAGAVLCYLLVGYPGWNTAPADGLRAMLHVPRLYFLIVFTACCCVTLGLGRSRRFHLRWSHLAWTGGMLAAIFFQIAAGIRHQRGVAADYAYRLPMPAQALLVASPQPLSDSVAGIAMFPNGYRVVNLPNSPAAATDQLSFAVGPGGTWIEEAGAVSKIITEQDASRVLVADAQSPMAMPGSHALAYLRQRNGQGQLHLFTSEAISQDTVITPDSFNVSEAAPLADGSFAVAAQTGSGVSQIYKVKPGTAPILQPFGEARYPAVSPDQRWIVYSHAESGVWNLWLFDYLNQQRSRLTDSPCNQTEPAWEADSRTLLYSSDCGRALGFTAICRRTVSLKADHH